MDANIEAVLAEYDARAERESEFMQSSSIEDIEARKDEMLIHIGRDSAQLLSILIKAHGARTIVELGASYGYSTIWFAERRGRPAAGGRRPADFLRTAARQGHYIRPRLKQAGLSDFVEFRIGDAIDGLRQLETPVDFALIDLWRVEAPNPTPAQQTLAVMAVIEAGIRSSRDGITAPLALSEQEIAAWN